MRIGSWQYKLRRKDGDWIVNQSIGRERVVEFEITYGTFLGALLSLKWFPTLYRLSWLDPDVVKRALAEGAEKHNLTITRLDETQMPPA